MEDHGKKDDKIFKNLKFDTNIADILVRKPISYDIINDMNFSQGVRISPPTSNIK